MAELLRFELFNVTHKIPDQGCVTVPRSIIDKLYKYTLTLQQNSETFGFSKTNAPLPYLDSYYKEHILNHLKEFLLKYSVISYFYQQLREQKIITVGDPRLIDISLDPAENARYTFRFTPAKHTPVRDWRYLPFRPPERKNYKDIDKQATNFISEERVLQDAVAQDHEIIPGDWVLFEATLLNKNKKPIIQNFSESLWIQIGSEETSEPFRNLFLKKKRDEHFISSHTCLQEFFSQTNYNYTFDIFIKEILPYNYFSFESFKKHFRLKSERKMHQKIVEVYSFRNDISLRRAMIEEAFTLIGRTYPIDVPKSAILRQEKNLLAELQTNPDYTVYKLQSDFAKKVHLLAEKQVRESLLIDYFSVQENINIEDEDVFNYLNLTKRPRTKEFIHFIHPDIKANEEELPISHESLKYLCTKEKTVNHILYHLTK